MYRKIILFSLMSSLLIACVEQAQEAVSKTKQQTEANTVATAAVPEMPAAHKKTGPHGSYDPHSTLSVESLIKVALQHHQEGRPELALQTLAEAIQKFPQSAEPLAVRASMKLQSNQVTEALKDLEKAVTLAPDDAQVRVNRAQAYRAFGREGDALADLDYAISVSPDLIAARFNRGAMLYAKEDFEKALADFDHCIAVDPHSAAPYYNRASTFKALQRDDEATADLERFIQLTDNEEWKKSAEELLTNWTTPATEDKTITEKQGS